MRLYTCPKTVLRFRPKASDFLKGYTTNAPDEPRTAFLSREGRIVAVADQLTLSTDETLIVIESRFAVRLFSHLKPFLDFSETQVLPDESLKAYFDLEGSYSPASGEWTVPQKKGQLILTSKDLAASVTEGEFKKFRLEIGLPIQGIDFDEEMLLCVGDEEYVSYTKGCYLGQEIIARVHFRGAPPKRLVAHKEGFVFVVQ